MERVRKTALRIAAQVTQESNKHPDLLTIELAALLHDVLDKKYVSAEQAADPYAFFLPFFQSSAAKGGVDLVSDGRAREIARIVDNVSWSMEKRLRVAGLITPWHKECVELHCVQDADRLDAIGAFGKLLFVVIFQQIVCRNGVLIRISIQGIMRCAAFSTVSSR